METLIIQGGMGVAVSGWRLARAVSSRGQLGVVSGTALDVVLARRRHALAVAGASARRQGRAVLRRDVLDYLTSASVPIPAAS